MEFKWSNLLIKLSITIALAVVLSNYPMKISNDYAQVLCLPSDNHVPHIYRSRYRALSFRVFVTLMFDKVCTVLYPTCRTGFECGWKVQTSCKRHIELHGSIPCQAQKFLNSPKGPDGMWSSMPPIKGVLENQSLGNKAAVVRSEQLKIQSDVDVNK